jgi:chromosome segregation ATPase
MKDGTQETLLREIDIMKDKLQLMQTQVDSNAEEHNLVVKASNQKLHGLIDENSQLMEKLELQIGSVDVVEEQMKEKDTEISDLTTDIEDLQEELAKLKREKKKAAIRGSSDLLVKIASLKKVNVSLKEQLEAEKDESPNSLRDESDVIATLKTKVSRLQLDLASSKSVNMKILESESRLKDKLASSQTLRDSESDRMQEAIDKLLVENKTLEEEMKDGRTRTAVNLKKKDDTIAELQAQITGLKGAVNKNSSSASTELELQKSRFESLQVELEEAKAGNTLLRGAMKELQAHEAKSSTLTDEQKSDSEGLKAKVDEWKSKASSLQEKVKDSASQVADWKRRSQEWEKEAAEWESVATGAQSAPTARVPPQSMYLSAASAGKKKEDAIGWGSLSNMFSRHSDHPRNAVNAKIEEDDERVEMLETQNTALKETLTKLQCQLAETDGE